MIFRVRDSTATQMPTSNLIFSLISHTTEYMIDFLFTDLVVIGLTIDSTYLKFINLMINH